MERNRWEKVIAAVEKVQELMDGENISAEVYQYMDLPVIAVDIRWGDWKHDHLRADYLMEERTGFPKVNQKVTEEDGSDCYSATHYYIVPEV